MHHHGHDDSDRRNDDRRKDVSIIIKVKKSTNMMDRCLNLSLGSGIPVSSLIEEALNGYICSLSHYIISCSQPLCRHLSPNFQPQCICLITANSINILSFMPSITCLCIILLLLLLHLPYTCHMPYLPCHYLSASFCCLFNIVCWAL